MLFVFFFVVVLVVFEIVFDVFIVDVGCEVDILRLMCGVFENGVFNVNRCNKFDFLLFLVIVVVNLEIMSGVVERRERLVSIVIVFCFCVIFVLLLIVVVLKCLGLLVILLLFVIKLLFLLFEVCGMLFFLLMFLFERFSFWLAFFYFFAELYL